MSYYCKNTRRVMGDCVALMGLDCVLCAHYEGLRLAGARLRTRRYRMSPRGAIRVLWDLHCGIYINH
jgi:hypothetical protein